MEYKISRVAAIHDISGFGRCSLTVVIPILSAMGMQVCPMPTAVLSTHTGGFSDFEFIDLTKSLPAYAMHWKRLNLQFDSIYSGFLGSLEQFQIVSDFINAFGKDKLVLIDPVFADNGKLYGTFTAQMVDSMRQLIKKAQVITPNITEAAFLLRKDIPKTPDAPTIKSWLLELSELGPETVVITSVPFEGLENMLSVVAYSRSTGRFWRVSTELIPAQYPGTGDTFASVLLGRLLLGDELPLAIGQAACFVTDAIKKTYEYKTPEREGIILEAMLSELFKPYNKHIHQEF